MSKPPEMNTASGLAGSGIFFNRGFSLYLIILKFFIDYKTAYRYNTKKGWQRCCMKFVKDKDIISCLEPEEALKNLLPSYESYYSIDTNPLKPFSATAFFSSNNTQYFLVKSAQISQSTSSEYVYFLCTQNLTTDYLCECAQTAWNNALAKIKPSSGHRNSDVTLIVIAKTFNPEVLKTAHKIKKSKSYKLSLWGWSSFRLAGVELTSGKLIHNRLGASLLKIMNNICSKQKLININSVGGK